MDDGRCFYPLRLTLKHQCLLVFLWDFFLYTVLATSIHTNIHTYIYLSTYLIERTGMSSRVSVGHRSDKSIQAFN